MLRYILDQHEIVAAFVAQLIPRIRARGFGKCKAIGVLDEQGRLIGGMVYHHFDPESGVIEMSGAATDPRWLSRETLARVYRYPFVQCGCQMVLMRVERENERLLRQLAAFNYSFILVPRMYGRDRDGVLCLLTDDAWRANKFCKRFKHDTVEPVEEAA